MLKMASCKRVRRHVRSNIHDIVDILDQGSDVAVLGYIQSNGDINVKDMDENTLLHRAVARKDCKRVKLLLSKGCNQNIRNRQDKSPLIIAFEKNDIVLARCLLNGKPNAETSIEDPFVLLAAIYNRNVQLVHLILEHGGDCNIEFSEAPHLSNYAKSTPVTECIKLNYLDIFDILMENGNVDLDLNLSLCYKKGSQSGCELLLRKGANPFKQTKYSVCMPSTPERFSVFDQIILNLNDAGLQSSFLLKTIIKEYGFSLSTLPKNQMLSSLFTLSNCVINRVFRTVCIARDNPSLVTQILCDLYALGMQYQDFSSLYICSLCDKREMCHICKALKLKTESKLQVGRGHVTSLQMQCRRTIREMLMFGLSEKVKKLPLPAKLKFYIEVHF